MPLRRPKLLLALLLAACIAGCARRAPVAYGPPITVEHLAPGLAAPQNGFELLTDVHTQGRFACPLAIAKLTRRVDDSEHALALEATRPAEQAYWTEQLRGIGAIREVIFLSPVSVRPDGDAIANLCASAQRLGALLLLVYAPSGVGPNSAQVLGVLYDTRRCEALAALHASSVICDAGGQEVDPGQLAGDQRPHDARHQAQRSFEGYTFACLRELIHRDAPPATTQPHRWQQPLMERWWVRTRH